MKKLLSVLVPVLAASLVFAPQASADDPFEDYLLDVSNVIRVTSSNESDLLIGGLSVCVDLLSGITITQEYRDIVSVGIEPDQAAALIEASIIHLCPSAAGMEQFS